mgnify:CR=1 FL=1|tara:strand:- start:275 stop:523 length:249 start_codon:yes stop_codon:yes gene_type:complete
MDKLLEEFIKDWRLKNNSKDAIYSSYHYDAMIEFAKHYHSQQLILSGVSKAFVCGCDKPEISWYGNDDNKKYFCFSCKEYAN